jgi:hypothetical protein
VAESAGGPGDAVRIACVDRTGAGFTTSVLRWTEERAGERGLPAVPGVRHGDGRRVELRRVRVGAGRVAGPAGQRAADQGGRGRHRAAAIDTGAIEGLYEVDRGFTMTVARGVAAWEKVLAAREPVVRRSFEDALGGVVMAGIQARGILTYSTIDAAGRNADRVEPAFQLVSSDATPMPVELRDIFPVLSSVLRLKLGIWADNVVAQLLADLDAESRRALRDSS